MGYIKINFKKKEEKEDSKNYGFFIVPILISLLLFLITPLIKEAIINEISNPTLPSYVINFLNDSSIINLISYGLPILFLFFYYFDYRSEKEVNLLGLLSGITLIMLSIFGVTSLLTLFVGYFLLIVSLI
ncbi:MAG TPA: hypothetical protein EYH54_00010 [Nautiliaceae bacterium]|nr:hypothetical protein [Nautiliaceae bacterium]